MVNYRLNPSLKNNYQHQREIIDQRKYQTISAPIGLSLIHISEPTRREWLSRMPSSA